MKKIVAANTVAQLIGRGISALTTLLVTVVVARKFGATGYGDFVKVTTYVAFFYLAVDFGINAIFIQRAPRDYWPALVTLRFLGGVGLIILSLLVLLLLPGTAVQGYTPAVRLGILLFSPTILFQGLITTSNAVFQKKLRYDFAAWAIFFGSLVTAALIFGTSTLYAVLTAVAGGTLVVTALSFWFAGRLVGNKQFVPSVQKMKQLLLPSLPLGVTLLFNLVYFRADSVIITLTRPTPEVGFYGLAYKVFEVILVFPVFFMNAVYPLMVKRRESLKKILTNSIVFLLAISLLSSIAVWFAAPLVTFIKSDFTYSIGALRVLALGLPFFFVSAATMWGLIAAKKQNLLLPIYGISMFINILGNILLVPTYGFIAAAWMTVVGEGVVLLLSINVLRKNI